MVSPEAEPFGEYVYKDGVHVLAAAKFAEISCMEGALSEMASIIRKPL